MKVFFINTVYKKGSTGKIVDEIGRIVEKNGGEYKVAYGRGTIVDDPHTYYIGSRVDKYIHAGLSRITDRTGFYSKYATIKLIKKIEEFNPDIINLHNLHGYYINVEILFKYLKDVFPGKVVWTLHDCWSFTGHCVHYLYAGCEKWKKECHSCEEIRRYPSSYLKDSSKKNYEEKRKLFTGLKNMVIVTPSQWLCNQVKMSFLSEYPIYVINNGIDLAIFKKKNVEVPAKKIILNVTDGKDLRKGYKDIIKLRKLLSEEYLLIIVGVNASKKEHYKGIEFINRTDSVEKLVEYYNMATYLINPTYEDTFPTINMEAIACGTPVITYAAGGSPEVIGENCGAIIPVGDVESMAYAIMNNIGDSDACVRESVKFDKLHKYQEYYELFKKMMVGN